MAKRRNDGAQESKEDYEARQAREEESDNEQGTGFSRASADVMKTRRKLVISSRFKQRVNKAGSSGSNMVIPPPRSMATGTGTTPSTANPFASTTLTPSTGINTSTKTNPFANVTFTTTMSDGISQTSTSVPSATINTSSKSNPSTLPPFISPLAKSMDNTLSDTFSSPSGLTIPSTKSITAQPLPTLRKGAIENESIPISKKVLFNIKMFKMAQKEYQHNPLSDWSNWLRIRIDKSRAFDDDEIDESQDEKKETTNNTSITSTGGTSGTTTSNGGFSFGSKSLSTSKGGEGGGFSFGPPAKDENDSSTDTKPTATFTGFSFTPKPSDGITTTPSTTPNTTKTLVDASNESSTNGEPSDDVNNNDKSDPLQKTLNKDEISLFECESASDAVSDMTFNRRMSSK